MNKHKAVNKESIGQLTWRLIVICVIAAVLLGGTYAVTKDPIAKQDQIKSEAAKKEVLPDASSFETIDLASAKDTNWKAEYDAITEAAKALSGDKTIGYVFSITAKGYNPGIKLTVGIGTDGLLKGVSITEMSETPGLGAKARDSAFRSQYKDKSIDTPLEVVKGKTKKPNEIQAITSSTITSKGITSAVNNVIDLYRQYFQGKEQQS
jgi:electron transport complex protein RnfG